MTEPNGPPAPGGDISTEDFGGGKFRQHGELHMHLEGDVIVYIVRGPFNLETITALGKARRAGLAQWQARQRKLSIAIFENTLLMAPEALQAYTEGLKQYFDKAPKAQAVAWVVPASVQGRALMLPKFEKLFADLGVPWRVFEQLEDARAWVNGFGQAPAG
jgi:hypothetical protein